MEKGCVGPSCPYPFSLMHLGRRFSDKLEDFLVLRTHCRNLEECPDIQLLLECADIRIPLVSFI